MVLEAGKVYNILNSRPYLSPKYGVADWLTRTNIGALESLSSTAVGQIAAIHSQALTAYGLHLREIERIPLTLEQIPGQL